MQTWAITDPGNIREQNQDAYAVINFGHERMLLVVCDGMGGAKSGNVASSLAVEVFTEEVRRVQKTGMRREAIDAMLTGALQLANQAVFDQAHLSEEFRGMGTTLVAALPSFLSFMTKHFVRSAHSLSSRHSRIDRFSAVFHYSPVNTSIESVNSPFTSTFRCKCGPVAQPLSPTSTTACPCTTTSPLLHQKFLKFLQVGVLRLHAVRMLQCQRIAIRLVVLTRNDYPIRHRQHVFTGLRCQIDAGEEGRGMCQRMLPRSKHIRHLRTRIL